MKGTAAGMATAMTAASVLAATPLVLNDGTPVRMRLMRTVTSADSNVGDTIDFEVLEDIVVDGRLVVARGAVALATVTEAQSKRRMGRAGKLNINIDYVRLANNDKAALRAIKDVKGDGKTGTMTGAMVATSLVFFPAAPLFLFMKGKDVHIPKGTEITAYVNGDIRLDGEKFKEVTE
jgi:hypothetical protein